MTPGAKIAVEELRDEMRTTRITLGILYALTFITMVVGAYLIVNLVHDQRDGRRFAVLVVCGATSAIADAGHSQIAASTDPGSPEFVKNLEALGYPPKAERERAAQKAAAAYSELIARKVEEASGVKGIVRKNGTLDCKRFAALARTTGD